MFTELQKLVKELNDTNSNNEKITILKKYPQCKKALLYTYNPYWQYGITSDNLKKNTNILNSKYTYNDCDFFKLLDDLKDRKITGHVAIGAVNGFIDKHSEFKDLFYRIIDKDLKTRTAESTINKAFENLIPEFKVALAKKYDDYADRINFKKEDWYASRKLDGVRLITIIRENGDIEFFSRNGKPFETLGKLKEDLQKKIDLLYGKVLDGEICVVDKEGNENFKGIAKQFRRKDYTIPNPKYKVFDILPLKDFLNAECSIAFIDRLLYGADLKLGELEHVDTVPQTRVRDKDHLTALTKQATDSGWEGLILRKNVPYEGKRTKDMLKVKKMQEAEYVVMDIEHGSFRVIDKKTGLEKEEEMLAHVFIEHKGNRVGVGSGFTIEERRKYYNNPELIIGKEITINYFEECEDKNGKKSLRFPVVKHVWEEGKRNI